MPALQHHDQLYSFPWITPESFTPSQYLDRVRSHARTGEQRLLLATIADALHALEHNATINTDRARRLFLDAYNWFVGPMRPPLISLEMACEHLRLDDDMIRASIVSRYEATAKTRACELRHGQDDLF